MQYDHEAGMIKVTWQNVRERVAMLSPTFASMVDELSPDEQFPLYLAYYPYGAIKGDTVSTVFPDQKGGFYRITDAEAPREVAEDLGYSRFGSPLAMLLDKNLELYVDLKDEGVIIPRILYSPGAIFPLAKVLGMRSQQTFAPNGVLTLSSGARSVFMLPNIGCATNHSNLRRDFNVQSPPPKSLYEHWFAFREIANSNVTDSSWRSCLLYFSNQWIDKLHTDKAWAGLRLYFHELAWKHYEHQRNRFYYDIVFSVMQKKRNLKPNPYLVDTSRHLFSIASGASPGYVPAQTNDALPLDMLREIYQQSYGLKKYHLTILQPHQFRFASDEYPIYYSLQYLSSHMFSPKSRKISSTLTEMRELEHITQIFTQELAKETSMCADSTLGEMAKSIQFQYFHNKSDRHQVVRPTQDILQFDDRFKKDINGDNEFAADAPFVRGCVSIQRAC